MKKTSSGYYEKFIDVGRDPETGKRIRKVIRAKTPHDLERKTFEFRQEAMANSANPGTDIIFETYAKKWLATKAGKSINTRKMYADVLDRYILPDIGERLISEIGLETLQGIINQNFRHPNTCVKIRLVFRQIHEMALDDGATSIRINYKYLAMPKVLPVTEKRALTPEEKEAVFNANLPDMERAFLFVEYFTGMRREEALALLPTDFDFDRMTVHINKTVVFDDNEPVLNIGMAKTRYSIRTIPLPDKCLPFLKDYVQSCDSYLFHQVRGSKGLMSKTSYNKFWRRIHSELVKLVPSADSITAYTFRHNYATLLYYSDIKPKMAAKLMGHKDTTMILRIYAHLDEEREMADIKLNKVFS